MGSTTTNRRGVAAFNFATVSGCYQLAVGPNHALGGTLDLMTDVHDLVWAAVAAPIGNSDLPLCRKSFRLLRLFQTCVLAANFAQTSSQLE